MKQIENRMIGGVRQYFGIYSSHPDNPILLHLHGGPADSCIPLIEKHNMVLAENFTLVVLEQRGAGLSYYKFSRDEDLSIQTFVQDIYELAEYLLERFGQEKLYIVGHSWGSVLGVKFIEKYPQLVKAYMGCGQVVNMQKNLEFQRKFVLDRTSSTRVRNKLSAIQDELKGEHWVKSILYVTKQVVKHGGSTYGRADMNSLILPFLCSKSYSVHDLINRQRGSLQGIQYFLKGLMEVDFTGLTYFNVPVILVEGRHDFHVSSEIARNWHDNITSEKDFYWFEESGHFPQWEEPERFNALVLEIRDAYGMYGSNLQ